MALSEVSAKLKETRVSAFSVDVIIRIRMEEMMHYRFNEIFCL
jgi:hypothetical protein